MVLFVFQFYPVCNFGKFISFELALSGMKGLINNAKMSSVACGESEAHDVKGKLLSLFQSDPDWLEKQDLTLLVSFSLRMCMCSDVLFYDDKT